MAEVNCRKEIIDNHSTEEVVSYIAKGLRRALKDYERGEETLVATGALVQNIKYASELLDELDQKLTQKSPVVA